MDATVLSLSAVGLCGTASQGCPIFYYDGQDWLVILLCVPNWMSYTGGDPTGHNAQDSHSILIHSEYSSKEG